MPRSIEHSGDLEKYHQWILAEIPKAKSQGRFQVADYLERRLVQVKEQLRIAQ